MFREMRRSRQALSKEEIIDVLKKETRGVLSLLGDDGYPYGIPMNHYYDEETGKLFFHGSKVGHKADAIKNNPKVSYCVFGQDRQNEGDWAKYVKSVVAFGNAELIEDPAEVDLWSRRLCSKFPCPPEYAEDELKSASNRVGCFFVHIEHISGKLVHEA